MQTPIISPWLIYLANVPQSLAFVLAVTAFACAVIVGVAGKDEEHGEEWEQAFSDIHLLYCEIYDKRMIDRLKDRIKDGGE